MFVKNKTFELCMEAVQRDGLVLSYVKDKTPEVIKAALKQNKAAKKYINE